MGDFNQLLWVKNNISKVEGPILEIGSKFYSKETFMDYRSLFKGHKFLGVDLSSGQNVDKVLDFTLNFEALNESLDGQRFKTIICCSVMEHVSDIYKFATNVQKILNPGGVLFLSVPFTWEFHGYPSDYWRFTPKAIEFLYSGLEFPIEYRTISSHIDHDIQPLIDDPNPFAFIQIKRQKNATPKSRIKSAVKILLGKPIDEIFVSQRLDTDRILKVSCINMMGFKK